MDVQGQQRRTIAELEAENVEQRQEIEDLVVGVDPLRGLVSELSAKLNTSSRNSSAPQSSDSTYKKAQARKSRSKRRRQGRAKLKAGVRRRGPKS